MRMESRVEAFIRARGVFEPGSRILVACSGGPDSVALASVLLAMRDRWRLTLRIAHFEHGIRGAASRADADFVRAFAAARGLAFTEAREDVPAYARRARLSLETAARERRYRFLTEAARAMGGGALIATGHHADDQAETVLLRLLRGTGPDGLAAMRPRDGARVRPLLFLSRAEIEAYLRERGLAFCTDETNAALDAARNRVRLELLPALRRYNPSIGGALCRLAAASAETADFLNGAVDAAWREAVAVKRGGFFLRRAPYRGLHPAVRKGLLRRIAEGAGLRRSLGAAQYDALDALCVSGGAGKSLALGGAWRAECRYDDVAFWMPDGEPPYWEAALRVPGTTRVEAVGLTVYAAWCEAAEAPPDETAAAFDADALRMPCVVRMRRPGDAFRLEGGGRQKVKSLLIDRKVPRALRGRVPVFTSGEEIFWVGGLRRAAFAPLSERTKRAVVFRIVWDAAAETGGVRCDAG